MLRDYCSYRTIKNLLRGSSGLLLDDFHNAVGNKKSSIKIFRCLSVFFVVVGASDFYEKASLATVFCLQ